MQSAGQSAKERQAKRRAKVKKDDQLYQAHLKRDRKRKEKARAEARKAMSSFQLEEYHVKERQRVRQYRAKKRMERQQPNLATPYRTVQARGKAIRRAQAALPISPRKKMSVVESLAKQVGLKVESSPTVRTQNCGGLSSETEELILTFYNKNDISWQAPGRKDRIIIRETSADGAKSKKMEQVRYMLMSLKEAHYQFTNEHPENKIGLTKFCELRPQYVKLFDNIPHHVFVCS